MILACEAIQTQDGVDVSITYISRGFQKDERNKNRKTTFGSTFRDKALTTIYLRRTFRGSFRPQTTHLSVQFEKTKFEII